MTRKYLEEIGARYSLDRCAKLTKDVVVRLRNQFNTYGFDERETWDLAYTTAVWIYQRLRMFRDLASDSIDLEDREYVIQDRTSNRDITRTARELLDMTIHRLETYLKFMNRDISEDVDADDSDEEQRVLNGLSDALLWYSLIINDLKW